MHTTICKTTAFAAILCLLTGCLSVARIAKLDCVNGIHRWDEERQEWVWEKCSSPMPDPLSQFGLYPTMQMRWQMARLIWNWSPPKYRVQRRVALPCVEILLLPGAVVDVVVDTVALPWDWKYRGNSKDIVADELEEKQLRSKCHFCGKTSHGTFSVCESAGIDYGVCQSCCSNAVSTGYVFTGR